MKLPVAYLKLEFSIYKTDDDFNRIGQPIFSRGVCFRKPTDANGTIEIPKNYRMAVIGLNEEILKNPNSPRKNRNKKGT